jgi:hypothetical protein
MKNETKKIESKWWRIEVPHDWRVDETRSGKILYTPLRSQIEIFCIKSDVGDITVNDFETYAFNRAKDEVELTIIAPSYLYSKIEQYGGDFKKTRWGVGFESYLLVVTYQSELDESSRNEIEVIDQIIRNVKFLNQSGLAV